MIVGATCQRAVTTARRANEVSVAARLMRRPMLAIWSSCRRMHRIVSRTGRAYCRTGIWS